MLMNDHIPNRGVTKLREEIGSRMKTERDRLGLTQSELAEMLGVIRLTVVKYEAGISCPGIDQIHTLKANNFDTDFVVDGYTSLNSEAGRHQFSAILSWVQREAEISGLELDVTQQIDAAWFAFDQLRRTALSSNVKSTAIESAVQHAIARGTSD
jgi:transcriptional regulator with XRE-family HTH domain